MNNKLTIGQVLWLKVRYQIDVVATEKHPMLIAEINDEYIELIALDKTAGKLQQLYHEYNLYIDSLNPKESVIYEDSYAQLNTKLTIENFEELIKSRKTTEKLSKEKLNEVLSEYKNYQMKHIIDENRIVYMDKKEVIALNNELN